MLLKAGEVGVTRQYFLFYFGPLCNHNLHKGPFFTTIVPSLSPLLLLLYHHCSFYKNTIVSLSTIVSLFSPLCFCHCFILYCCSLFSPLFLCFSTEHHCCYGTPLFVYHCLFTTVVPLSSSMCKYYYFGMFHTVYLYEVGFACYALCFLTCFCSCFKLVTSF